MSQWRPWEVQDFSDDHLNLILVIHTRYTYTDRPLCHDEVCKMMGLLRDREDPPLGQMAALLDTFENPEDEVTMWHQSLIQGREEQLLEQAEDLFMKLQDKSEEVRDFAFMLVGLTKRFPSLQSLVTMPVWQYEEIRWDQLTCLFVLCHFCQDHQGKNMTAPVGREIAAKSIFHGQTSQASRIFTLLSQADHQITITIAEVLLDTDMAKYFGEKVHGFHRKYTREKGLPEPRLVLPTAAQSADLWLFMSALPNMSVEAPAGPSNQEVGPGDEDESLPQEEEESGKGKAKQQRNESSTIFRNIQPRPPKPPPAPRTMLPWDPARSNDR